MPSDASFQEWIKVLDWYEIFFYNITYFYK
jgi:hypothetical protein